MSTASCPCGSARSYANCCGRYLDGAEQPETAEALMRSRYVAYARGRADYLGATWHSASRPAQLAPDPSIRWIGLKILSVARGGAADSEGEVEFVARYKIAGRAHRLHERSRFVREKGRWVYVTGDLSPD